jgi:hypothetical protein
MASKVKSLLFRYLQVDLNPRLFDAGWQVQLALDLQRGHGNQFWPLAMDYCELGLSLVGTGFAIYNAYLF